MQNLPAYFNLGLAMLLVGSAASAGKLMLEDLPIFLSSALRFALAFALMLPLLYWREKGLPKLSKRSYAIIGLQALCGSFLFTFCILAGLAFAPAAEAGVVTSVTPACMALAAWILFGQRPGGLALAGIALSVAGVALLRLWPWLSGESEIFVNPGWLLYLAAVIFESLFLLLRKAVPEPLSPLAASTLVCGFGLLYFAPLAAYQALSFDFRAVSAASWLAVAYYGVCVTVLAYLLWFSGVVRASASLAGAITALMPLSAVCCSWLVLNEPLPASLLFSCLLVFTGIILCFRPAPQVSPD